MMRASGLIRGGAAVIAACAFLVVASVARADDYADTVQLFKNAGESQQFFKACYGYAIFPTVGEGGFIVGAAVGKGRVYARGRLIGDTTLTQISAGFQAGGKAYSQIIFFQDKRALDEFTSGSFEFEAGASAIAITASAGASAGTNGVQANASGGMKDATTAGQYNKGVAVFTIGKGGLMYAATLAGQHYSYKPRGAG